MNTPINWQQLKKTAFDAPLSGLFEADELRAMWLWWLEKRADIDRSTYVSRQFDAVTAQLAAQLAADVLELQQGVPFQYVINESWFLDRSFVLNRAVLIPRPETEELVRWILEEEGSRTEVRLIDLGSGSGIIPISIALAKPAWQVYGLELSPEAMATAQENAQRLGATVQWIEGDMLEAELPAWDILVSNPPYIPYAEADSLLPRVREQEPAMALFSPDEEPLLFYRSIANRMRNAGKGKTVYLELNYEKAPEIGGLFEGFECEFKSDLQGKARMLRVRS